MKDTNTSVDYLINFIEWATLLSDEEMEALKNIYFTQKIKLRWKRET